MNRVPDTDVVVVGSGATGGWACKTLTEAGFDVTLLEAGTPMRTEDCPDQWYGGSVSTSSRRATSRQGVQSRHPAWCDANAHLFADDVDNPYVTEPGMPFTWIRSRREGGRSNLWGAQCWRLTDAEFKAPLHDGYDMPWPVSYEELRPHYDHVERFHGLRGRADESSQMVDQVLCGDVDLTAAEERARAIVGTKWGRWATATRTAIDDRQTYRDSGRWPRFSSLGSTLPAAWATGYLHIIHNAVVSNLRLDEGNRRVEGVRYIDATSGREDMVRARAVVLCASTIESTRILLHSAGPGHRQGLGNSSGTLGRFLMDHNATFALGRVAGETLAGTEFFGGRHGIYLPHFESALGHTEFRRGYGVWLALGRDMGHGLNALMTAVGEMLPYRENNVTLDGTTVDRWGLPVPRIACTAQANESRMRAHQGRTLRALADALGIELAVGPEAVAPGAMVHEVGTARMGADAASSFCNGWARSWDVQNLYVPDGACWTTSAYQNPTLTMMAMAHRSASHLAAALRQREFA